MALIFRAGFPVILAGIERNQLFPAALPELIRFGMWLLFYPCLNFYKNAMVEFLTCARILRSAFMGACVTKKKNKLKMGKSLKEAEEGGFFASPHIL